ncbi:MAG: ATP-dependent DNA helicase RecQ [Proteobacteria bacterium]|nr:ATP-dependent DNA helicase RecQ [Pseudomonadota bacterium]
MPQLTLFGGAPEPEPEPERPPEPPPASSDDPAVEVLQRIFGYPGFRPGQRPAIDAVLAGRDAVVVLPTGGGKSLCFQVPAILRHEAGEGPTLVVSPLIALMDDQVSALRSAGVPAVALHSGHGRDGWRERRDEARDAALIYVSPEKLKSEAFQGWLEGLDLSAAAVDEAHCVSEWGHDFRPDYLNLSLLKRRFDLPVIALTATATMRVMEEVAEQLELPDPAVVRGDFTRPNLAFGVELVQADKARTRRIVEFVKSVRTGRAVVYAATRKRVQAVDKALRGAGIKSGYYHAGRSDSARANAAAAFESGKKPVLVATTAFGMGIDRPDVRLVVHANASGSLAAYYQEAGRAGRDGEPARCVLLYSTADAVTHARLRGRFPAPGAVAGWGAMQDYVYGTGCRQRAVVAYFTGEPGASCGSCDVCTDPAPVRDAVAAARSELRSRTEERVAKKRAESAFVVTEAHRVVALEFVGHLRKPLGKSLVAKGLRGSKAKAVKRKGLAKNPNYGALKEIPEAVLLDTLEELLEEGRLVRKGRKYPTMWLPDKRVRPPRDPNRPPRPAPSTLRVALRAFRASAARKRRWKPYQVFTNQTLGTIAADKPATLEELLAIKGMGPKRVAKFGEDILEVVRSFEDA